MDLIDHFERKISDPFKGMVVTVSREAAIKYKKTLNELNGPESAVMISGHHNDRQGAQGIYSFRTAEKEIEGTISGS